MNMNRKINHNSETSKPKKARNSSKKHLLSKPNARKFSLSKFTNSFSTLASHTGSKINNQSKNKQNSLKIN